MGGFSIYLLFLSAGLFAAPRRPPTFAIIASMAVTIFFLQCDVSTRKQAIQGAVASGDMIMLAKAEHAIAASRN